MDSNSNPGSNAIVFTGGGASGVITLLSELPAIAVNATVTGPGSANLTISGGSAYQIFSINSGVAASISGLTIANGAVTGGANGGAVFNAGSLTISTTTFNNNSASGGDGGAIENSGGTLIVTSVVFTNNSASLGGGIQISSGTATVSYSTFTGNSAGAGGGAIDNLGTLTVNGGTFASNTVTSGAGGAIVNDGQSGFGAATITGAAFNNNTASGNGGAVQSVNSGALAIVSSTFTSNTATNGSGGGVEIDSGSGTINNSAFTGNQAQAGGGIETLTTLDVANSTFNSNTAVNNGGGIDDNGTLTVSSSTFTGNSAGAGGGIYGFQTLDVSNSTISGNSAGAGGGLDADPASSVALLNSIVVGNTTSNTTTPNDISGTLNAAESQYNLIGTGGSGGLTSANNNQVNVSVASAGLAALANNGGPTLTIALQAGSPALQAGLNQLTTLGGTLSSAANSFSAADPTFLGVGMVIAMNSEQMLITQISGSTISVTRGVNGTTAATHTVGAAIYLPTDQRGSPRSAGTSTDIGAYETYYGATETTGTWTALSQTLPAVNVNGNLVANGAQTVIPLTNGTVMVQGEMANGNSTTPISSAWYQLSPNASGSYINGTFSSVASMATPRDDYPSNVLPSGNAFVVGGEFSNPATPNTPTFTNAGEIYDPVANKWTAIAAFPQANFGDAPTELLPSGNVLGAYVFGPQAYIYNTTTNQWSATGSKLPDGGALQLQDQGEGETWVKLSNGNILSYDSWTSGDLPTGFAQQYNPTTGVWSETGSVPEPLTGAAYGYELGPALLLPDGRVFQIGANSNTAFYSPSSNTWSIGPVIPNGMGAGNAPAVLLPSGHVLFAADDPSQNAPTQLFDFNPTTNTITPVTGLPAGLANLLSGYAANQDRMALLPNGDVLLSNQNSNQLWEFTPSGSASSSWQPTISTVSYSGNANYTLTGTQLNGLSEGASVGADAQMATNFPIVQLTNGSNVYYARTFNWPSAVATGSNLETTQFELPVGLPAATYSLRVIANGIASSTFSFTTGTWTSFTSPHSIGTMMLLSNGDVIAQGAGTSNAWYELTPNSAGSYSSGTWTTLASMSTARLYFASNVLPNGDVFVVGGEYSGSGASNLNNTGEIYDPVTNTWTPTANYPQGSFGDDPSEVLSNGTVLGGYVFSSYTAIYNPTTNTWTATAGSKVDGDRSDEEAWVKLPPVGSATDGDVLSYDVFYSASSGTFHAQVYQPSTGTWIEASTLSSTNPPSLLSSSSVGSELGPGFLLPDGRVLQIGANDNTALYTPSTGVWTAGPLILDSSNNPKGADDAPGAMMPNGQVLFAADTYSPTFTAPTELFLFNPPTNSITQLSTPSSLTSELNSAAFTKRMLVLPNGDVLLSNGSTTQWEYTPSGAPQASWAPTITSITANNNYANTYTLTGTQLNGISEGAAYGDDAEMSSNYPIVRLTSSSGVVTYARTFNWSSADVATGSRSETTQFTIPSGMAPGTYSLVVSAVGIDSEPVNFTVTAPQDFYADTRWAGLANGAVITDANPVQSGNQGAIIGTTAFASVDAAIAAATAVGGSATVIVNGDNGGGVFGNFNEAVSLTAGVGLVTQYGAVTFNSLADSAASAIITLNGTNLTIGGDNSSQTIDGEITGAGNLIKTGTGTLTLAGTDEQTGATTVSAGTLLGGSADSFSAASTYTVSSGAILQLAGHRQVVGGLSGAGTVQNANGTAATLTVGAANSNVTFSGTLQDGAGGGSLSLIKSGTAAFTLSGTASYTGTTTVFGGTLQAGANNSFSASSGITVNVGATLQTNGFSVVIGSLTGAGTVQNGSGASGTLTTGASGASTGFNGTIQNGGGGGTLSLVKTGAGTFTLSIAATYTGTTTVSGGILQAGVASAFSPNSATTVSSGATLDLNGFANALSSLAGAGTVEDASSTSAVLTEGSANTSTTFSGLLENGAGGGTLILVKTGTGTLTLSSANTYSGTTSIQQGAVVATANAALGSSAAGVTVTGGGILGFSGGVNYSNPNPVNLGQVTGAYVGFTGGTGGAASIQKILNWTYSSGSTSLNYSSGFATDPFHLNGGATISGTALELTDGNGSEARSAFIPTAVSVAGFTSTFQFTYGANPAADGLTFAIQNTGPTAVGGTGGQLGYGGIGNSLAVELNLYNNVSQLGVDTNGAIGYTTDLTASGINFHTDPTDTYQATVAYDGSGTVTVTITDKTSGATTGAINFSDTVPSTTGGSGIVENVSGTNSFAGAISLGASGTVQSVAGALTLSGNVALNGNALTVTGAGNTTLSGVVSSSGAGSLTKSGTGILTMSNNSTYTGATSVSAGVLLVNGSLSSSSAVTVASGATLGGNHGTVGSTTVNGNLTPGGPAQLTTGQLIFGSTGAYNVTLDGTSPGTGYDQVIVTSASGVNLSSSPTLNVAVGYTPAAGNVLTIIKNQGGGSVTGTFNNLPQGSLVPISSKLFTISYVGGSGHDVVLTATSAPTVTTQPSNQTVNAGGTAMFTATAGGNPSPTVQWQVNTGSGFTNLSNGGIYSGATATTLTITGATAAMSGYQYQAVFTNAIGSTTTNSATLTVDSITTQPSNETVNAGQTATFTAATSNPGGADMVQWQVNAGSGFMNLSDGGVYSGSGTPTLTITGAMGSMSGYQYQAVFTNTLGSMTTNSATLAVDSITTQPSNQTVNSGQNASFIAATSNPGGADTVQWQVNTGSGFMNLSDGGVYNGSTTKTLTITGATGAMSGYQYQAVFTNALGSMTTNSAALTVDSITTQPSNQTVDAGQNATFTAATTNPGGADTVQWQVNTGSGFMNLSDGGVYSGSGTPTLTITGATTAMSGYQYDAVFMNSAGSLTTNAAVLLVNPPPALAALPVVNGSSAVINIVSATGDGTTATITTDGTAHGFWVGELVTLTGVTAGGPGGLAGTVTVTSVPSATTFQFASSYSGSESLSGATVTAALAGVQRSMVDSIVYNFTEPVNLTAAAFSISVVVDNTSTGDMVGVAPTLNVAPVPFTNEWVVTFTDPVNNSVIGKSIANGAYSISINPALVAAVSDGQNPAAGEIDTFYRLYGDVTGAQSVKNVDANAFNRTWGNAYYSAAYNAALDYNDDGKYTNVDANAFNRAFNTRYQITTTI